MRINKLLEHVEFECSEKSLLDLDVQGVEIDSRKINKQSMFICLKGETFNGNNYINEAILNGAICIVTDQKPLIALKNTIFVNDARKAYSIISENIFNRVCDKLKVIAIVGTNGKSTTAYITYNILKQHKCKVGLIGTMYYEYENIREESHMTTPDPFELNKLFEKMDKIGIEYVVMEVSAHAIFFNKLFGICPIIKVFTNFSQDHLDFFNTMNQYRLCKKSYFLDDEKSKIIVNIDDDLGVEICNSISNKCITYGIKNPSDVFCINIEQTNKGSEYIINLFDNILKIETKLFGVFNVYNAMGAVIAAKLIGVSDKCVVDSLKNMLPPEGRFNLFNINSVKYIIDFAHTPDGIYNLLNESRKLTKRRVIIVFGCGGNRDKSKRPVMGNIAKDLSDIVILTSDNPRNETRQGIVDDIMRGMKELSNVYVELNRPKAIKLAYEIAECGDVVVIAGKGSENYVDENNVKMPYSDIEEVKKIRVQH